MRAFQIHGESDLKHETYLSSQPTCKESLKVGSCSFYCIIVLLTYFLHCRKATFYKEILKFQ